MTNRQYLLLLVPILLIASVLRLYRLGDTPAGFSQDEASEGYDAWCLLHTAHTRNGAFLPLFANTFEDYNEALYRYLLVPVVALTGLSEAAVRLPSALAGIMMVLAVAQLARQLFSDHVGLATAALYAVAPWHLVLSRLGMRMMLLPLGLTVGVWLLWRWAEAKDPHPRALVWITVWWGLLWYTYTPVRLVLPSLLFLMLWLHRRVLIARVRQLPGALAVFLLLSLPLCWMYLIHYADITARVRLTSIARDGDSTAQTLATFLSQYLAHFGIQFLFARGDQNVIMSVPGIGQLYWGFLPLILLGLVRLAMMADRRTALLAGWLLIGPLPSAATTWAPHAHRAIACEPAWSLVAGLGLGWVLSGVRSPRRTVRGLSVVAVCAVLIALLWETARFSGRYFGDYRQQIGHEFFAGLANAVRQLHRRESKYDAVLLSTDTINRPEIFYLFYGPFDPRRYLELRRAQGLGPDDDEWVVHFGHVWCGSPPKNPILRGLLLEREDRVPPAWNHAVVWRGSGWALVDSDQAMGCPQVFETSAGNAVLVQWSVHTDPRYVYLQTIWYDTEPEILGQFRSTVETTDGHLPMERSGLETWRDSYTQKLRVSLVHRVARPASGDAWAIVGGFGSPRLLGSAIAQERLRHVWDTDGARYGLESVILVQTPLASGTRVRFSARWRPLVSRRAPHTVILHYYRASETVNADHVPQPVADRHGLLLPGDALVSDVTTELPPAEEPYLVLVGWYDPLTGDRLQLLGSSQTLVEVGKANDADTP